VHTPIPDSIENHQVVSEMKHAWTDMPPPLGAHFMNYRQRTR